MKFKGKAVSEGIAIADILYLPTCDETVARIDNCDVNSERQRFLSALNTAKQQLQQMYEKASVSDIQSASVFQAHITMLDDPDFNEGVYNLLDKGLNAEYAVRTTGDNLKDMLASVDDEYLKARSTDVADITNTVVNILKGIEQTPLPHHGEFVVIANQLYPSQTMKLDKDCVKGFITRHGSATSHSVILARSLGIPCIVDVENFDDIPHHGTVALDGMTGEIIVNPSQQQIEETNLKLLKHQQEKEQLSAYSGKARSKSGKSMLVCANIGSVSDVDSALSNNADGVGLFRSEFVYLDSRTLPTEDTQFEIYRQVLEKMYPLPVTIRTLDIGSDKQAPCLPIGQEDNPAMGYRAIRICLEQQDIFVTQLKALLRASVYGNLNIMFPMVSNIEQIRSIKSIVQQVKNQLTAENIPFNYVPLGVMIETPASAVISDLLAKEVDFFSIGTNDLTQYTLAADRTNEKIAHLFDSSDIAVLRLVELTTRNAHANGITVSICGESAGDTNLTQFYIDIGIDKLSVSPSSVLKVKKAISECK